MLKIFTNFKKNETSKIKSCHAKRIRSTDPYHNRLAISRNFLEISKTVLPTPLDILQSFQALIVSGELAGHLQISLTRALIGFLIGAGLGLLFGAMLGLSNVTEQYVDPSLQMLRTVPHLALAPLFILWFGLGELSKVLLIGLGLFFLFM